MPPSKDEPTILLVLYARQARDNLGFIATRASLTDDEQWAVETVKALCDRLEQNL